MAVAQDAGVLDVSAQEKSQASGEKLDGEQVFRELAKTARMPCEKLGGIVLVSRRPILIADYFS